MRDVLIEATGSRKMSHWGKPVKWFCITTLCGGTFNWAVILSINYCATRKSYRREGMRGLDLSVMFAVASSAAPRPLLSPA